MTAFLVFIGLIVISVVPSGYQGIRRKIKESKQKKIEEEKSTIKNFTKNVIEEFPKEMISMAYYFVNESLKLTKVTKGTEEQTKSGKIIVST